MNNILKHSFLDIVITKPNNNNNLQYCIAHTSADICIMKTNAYFFLFRIVFFVISCTYASKYFKSKYKQCFHLLIYIFRNIYFCI